MPTVPSYLKVSLPEASYLKSERQPLPTETDSNSSTTSQNSDPNEIKSS
ncbi:MAG: hypothetical protein O9275_02010 [Microcystis sp. LE19-196.1B]|nr:hypothetical protein [Microcystis sp. LE19-196.1B]